MTVLERALKAAWAEVKKPEAYVKGDEFEDYVRQCLFPRERYDLLHRTHDYRANESDFVEGSKDPDFRFRSRRSAGSSGLRLNTDRGFIRRLSNGANHIS
jgi:hypothetical protein